MGRSVSVGRRSRALCVLGLIAVAVAVAGCGGSSPTPTTAATTPPPAASGTSPPGGLPGLTGPAGASTPTTPTVAASPAKARFVTQADRICLTTDNELEAQQAKVDAAVKAEQKKSTTAHRKSLAAGMREETSLAKAELTRLRSLKPPAADRAVVGGYLSAVASQVKLVDQFAQAVDDDDAAGVTTVSGKLTLGETTVDNLAKAYGFKVCGSTATPSS